MRKKHEIHRENCVPRNRKQFSVVEYSKKVTFYLSGRYAYEYSILKMWEGNYSYAEEHIFPNRESALKAFRALKKRYGIK